MTKIRTCKICGSSSQTVEFYSGVTSRCKECHKDMVKRNRDDNNEYYKEYDRKRFKEDPNVRLRHKKYQATELGKIAMKEARKRWLNKKPEARAAHIILGNAVKSGRIDKPSICSRCGLEPRKRDLHAHHEDYAKPLEVIWLCAMCHSDTHKT